MGIELLYSGESTVYSTISVAGVIVVFSRS